ncbi:hypothetical protein FHX82_003362 [Amycolatopsis bartoniae]|nr:hypothetical protein [Amycolatopsis bartoniae]
MRLPAGALGLAARLVAAWGVGAGIGAVGTGLADPLPRV